MSPPSSTKLLRAHLASGRVHSRRVPASPRSRAVVQTRRCDAVPCDLIADLRMGPADSPTELAQPRIADPEVMTHLVNDRPPNLLDDLGIAGAHRADGTPVDRDLPACHLRGVHQ